MLYSMFSTAPCSSFAYMQYNHKCPDMEGTLYGVHKLAHSSDQIRIKTTNFLLYFFFLKKLQDKHQIRQFIAFANLHSR